MLFSDTYDLRVGPLVPVRIALSGVADQVEAKGLLDTGASISVIPSQVAGNLDLRTKLIQPLTTVSGVRDHRVHRIVMTLVLDKESRPFTLWAFEAHAGWPDHNVLIGRDVIHRGVLKMAGDWFSFDVPDI